MWSRISTVELEILGEMRLEGWMRVASPQHG